MNLNIIIEIYEYSLDKLEMGFGGIFEMNWLRKFMYGRYGVDELSIALLIISLVLMLIGGFSS